jgi:hypothetical protein
MTKLQIKVGDHVLTKTQIEAESYNQLTHDLLPLFGAWLTQAFLFIWSLVYFHKIHVLFQVQLKQF